MTRTLFLSALFFLATFAAFGVPPAYDHVVVVIEENHSISQVLGAYGSAPYINRLADDGVAFRRMRGCVHPSQPNYLELFSGNNQGCINDSSLTGTPFTTANLGAALFAAGKTFAGYAEDLPATGDITTSFSGYYARYHCPWWAWCSATPTGNQLPPSVHKRFADFPSDYSQLPTVSFVVPSQLHNMHDGTVNQGDVWLQTNLSGYAEWAKTHNSLLVVVWDEDDFQQANRIPMLFYGANLSPSDNDGSWTLHNLLRTIEDMYGLTHSGRSAQVPPISGAFAGESPVVTTVIRQGLNSYAGTLDTYLDAVNPATAFGTATTFTSLSGSKQSLVRFVTIFGTDAAQVNSSAPVISSKLLVTTNSPGTSSYTLNLHRMLVNWNEASTWNSLVGGVTLGTDAVTAADFSAVGSYGFTTLPFDTTSSVELWRSGSASNLGFLINNTTTIDDWVGVSSNYATNTTYRPTLEVTQAGSAVSFAQGEYIVDESAGTVTITVTRTGVSLDAITATYSTETGYPAIAGSDFTATSGTLSWAAGDMSSRTITVPITADSVAENFEYTFISFSAYTGHVFTGEHWYAAIGIHDTAFNEWLVAKMGSAVANSTDAAPSADPDHDGISNILEYAAQTEPLSATSTYSPVIAQSGGFPEMTFNRNPDALDLTYTVQVSDDLMVWHDGSSYSSGGDTPSNAFTTQVQRTGTSPESITVRYNQSVNTGNRYMRLKVTLAQ